MENIADLWHTALANIEKKISKPSFDTWLKSTKAHSLQGNLLVITAPNEFARDWLEERYSQLISGILYDITGEELSVKFIIPQHKKEEEFELPTPPKKAKKEDEHPDFPPNILNPKYTLIHLSSVQEIALPTQLHWQLLRHQRKPTIRSLSMGELD